MRVGQLKVQCDRWPLTELKANHVLTVVIVGSYDSKPTKEEIAQACADAATIFREGKTV